MWSEINQEVLITIRNVDEAVRRRKAAAADQTQREEINLVSQIVRKHQLFLKQTESSGVSAESLNIYKAIKQRWNKGSVETWSGVYWLGNKRRGL